MRPLVGGVDQARGELHLHRPHREEAVRDRAERLAEPVRVREAGAAERRQLGSRLGLLDPGGDRVPERRVERRARAARALDRLEVVVAASPSSSRMIGSTSSGVWPGSSRRSTTSSHVPGITLRRSDASIIVGESVNESSGSIVSTASGSTAASRASTSSARRLLAQHRVEEARHLGADRRLRPVRGELLDQRRRLDERVVGDPRHRGVAAAAVHGDPDRRAHLLRGRAEVERAAAELDPLAAALVDRVVDADGVRMLLAEPLRGRSSRRPPRPRRRRRRGRRAA